MKRALFFLLGLAISNAFAQGRPPTVAVTTPAATTGALTLYVDAAGNDSSACMGTGAAACATIQGAIERIPKQIRHLVTVNVGAGNFAGANVAGFNIDSAPALTAPAGLFIQGTRSNATGLTTGTATGTSTAAANGASTTSITWGTMTDSGQAWTANNLRGRYLEITSGTGVGQIFPIVANTGTVVTVATTSWTPPTASGYAIRDIATIINATTNLAPSIPTAGASTAAASTAGMAFVGITGPARAVVLRMEFVRFAFTAFTQNLVFQSNVQASFARLSFTSTGASSANIVVRGSGGVLNLAQCVFIPSASGTVIDASQAPPGTGVAVSASYYDGSAGGATGFHGGGNMTTHTFANLYLRTISFPFNLAGSGFFSFSGGIYMEGSTSQGIRAQPSGLGYVGCNVNQNTGVIEYSNGSAAFTFDGPHTVRIAGIAVGTGNTQGIVLSNGARMKISSGSTVTGTSEVVLDGAAATTLAAMRAASPKHLKTELGTIIHE